MSMFSRHFLNSFRAQTQQRKSIVLSGVLRKLTHDEDQQLFVLRLQEGSAHVIYKPLNGVIELKHTYVPEIFRGKGVAAALAKEVLDYCLRNHIKVKITCSYLQGFYKEHAENYRSIVV